MRKHGFAPRREARTLSAQDPNAVKAVRAPVQLALRVSSISVTVITPGAGCSITSTATVSTTGVTGFFTFREAFFTGAGLGLALATVRFVGFAALAALRVLPRLAALRSFARFCTFDAFLRLATIAPFGATQRYNGPTRSQLSNASYQQIAADPLLTDKAPKRDAGHRSPCPVLARDA